MAENEKDEDVTIANLEKQVEELTKTLNAAIEAKGELDKAKKPPPFVSADDEEEEAQETKKALAEVQKQLDEAKAENEALKLDATMTVDEKEFCKDADAAAKKAFMAKSVAERRRDMDLKKSKDEVCTLEGHEIRKSVVGDAQFAILKATSTKLAQAEADIRKERDAREMAELTKRADDLYAHVPGTTQERANMLKVMDALEEPLRKAFEAVFTQSEKLAGKAFESVGRGTSPDEIEKARRGATDFKKRIDEIQAANKNMSRSDAMTKARLQYPDEFKAYQGN